MGWVIYVYTHRYIYIHKYICMRQGGKGMKCHPQTPTHTIPKKHSNTNLERLPVTKLEQREKRRPLPLSRGHHSHLGRPLPRRLQARGRQKLQVWLLLGSGDRSICVPRHNIHTNRDGSIHTLTHTPTTINHHLRVHRLPHPGRAAAPAIRSRSIVGRQHLGVEIVVPCIYACMCDYTHTHTHRDRPTDRPIPPSLIPRPPIKSPNH